MRIGIVILATNAYFILGIRFIKKFLHYYKGNCKIIFFFFSDESPELYLKNSVNMNYYYDYHSTWRDGTNSKFKNILNIENELKEKVDYVYYFDADTDIQNPFTEEWFLGDMVGGEHFGNRSYRKNGSGLDRNPKSKSYVPLDTDLPYTYYYGAFFGGKTDKVISFCKILRQNQIEDQKIKYEPRGHDESYINQHFHFNPPSYTVPTEKFPFRISHKGGIGVTRNTGLDITDHKNVIRMNRDKVFELLNNKISFL